ncbi:MAG: DUF3782 domain-containing protein [bacterium]
MTTLKKLEELIYKGFKETDARLAEHRRELEEQLKEQRHESDERIERMHQKLTKELNGVTDSLGRFSEQTVFPAIKRLFRERGIRLNLFYSNLEARDLDGDNMETDVVGTGPKCAVVIEVKLRLRQTDVKEFLEKKLPRFFDFFPGFRRPILYGGVAGMSIDKDVERFAYKKGLFVISQTGDNVQILNDKKFRPRSFTAAQDNRFPKRRGRKAEG